MVSKTKNEKWKERKDINEKIKKIKKINKKEKKKTYSDHFTQNKKDLSDKFLITITLVVFLFSVMQAFLINMEINNYLSSLSSFPQHQLVPRAADTGKATFCINKPPKINVSVCNNTAYERYNYFCKVNYTDPDGPSLLFESYFLTGNKTLFNITRDGIINFTPTNDDIGNYTVLITFKDLSGCSNMYTSDTLLLEVKNVNNPPQLIEPLPNVGLIKGSTIVPFYLLDYFTDPDIPYGDELSFLYIVNDSHVSISIEQSSRVFFSADKCPLRAYAIFTAVDIYNASANSNAVQIRVYCKGEGEGQEGAGAGAGGGAAAPMTICEPSWQCGPWHACLPNGTKYRNCVDENACDPNNYQVKIWKNCTYYAQCFNNVKDPNEEGIDCGGPCPPCGTCYDGIKNCHDGACEQDVDCGGPCKPCVHVEKPFFEKGRVWTNFLAALIAIFSFFGIIYAYFKREIDTVVNYMLEPIRQKKRKALLLSKTKSRNYLGSIHKLHTKAVLFKDRIKKEEFDRYTLKNIINLFARLSRLSHEILADAFSLDLSFTPNEFSAAIKKKRIPKPLKIWSLHLLKQILEIDLNIDKYLFAGIEKEAINAMIKVLEKNSENKHYKKLTRNILDELISNFIAILEELRSFVISISPLPREEILHIHIAEEKETKKQTPQLMYGEGKETPLDKELREILSKERYLKTLDNITRLKELHMLIIRIHVALQYMDLERAIDYYLKLLSLYNRSPFNVKETLYDSIYRLREAIDYYIIIKESHTKSGTESLKKKISTLSEKEEAIQPEEKGRGKKHKEDNKKETQKSKKIKRIKRID